MRIRLNPHQGNYKPETTQRNASIKNNVSQMPYLITRFIDLYFAPVFTTNSLDLNHLNCLIIMSHTFCRTFFTSELQKDKKI